MDSSTGITVYERMSDPLAAVEKLGAMFARSGFFGCEKPEQGQVLALACLSERKSPTEIMRDYDIIQGKLSMKAATMLARFHAAGGKSKIVRRTPEAAEVELAIAGDTQRFALTFDDAKKEPFPYGKDGKTLKSNWATPRARMQMLWARVVSDGVRSMCPEVAGGAYAPEELDGAQPEKAVAPLLGGATQAQPASTGDALAAAKPVEANVEPPAVIAEAVKVCAGIEADALAFLRVKGWVAAGGGLDTLKPEHAAKIVANPDGFKTAVGKHAVEQQEKAGAA